MILDWKRHCEKIERTKMLSREDPSDNKIYFKQEIAYIKYLSNQGLTFDECRKKWAEIKNGDAKQFSDYEQLDLLFRRVYNKSHSKTYSTLNLKEGLVPVRIFYNEVKKINSIQCEKWVKEYVLSLLIYHKFASQLGGAVEYSPSLINWILRQVDIGNHKFRSYRDARKIIMNTLRNNRFKVIKFTPLKKKGKYSIYTIPFSCEDGEIAIQLDSLDDLKKSFTLLREDVRVCEECGKAFSINAKTHRHLCEACYKKFRRKYKTLKQRDYRAAEKTGVEENCL